MILPKQPPEKVEELQQELLLQSSFTLNYVMLVISSCLIASLGLIADSTAVIIGAMIIAPLMLPIRGIALALLAKFSTLLKTGLLSLVYGTAIGIGISTLLGILISPEWSKEILARTQPNLLDLGVAIASGGIGAFAKVKKEISDSLAGVAIAVALMPPVCVIGLGLSQLDWPISWGACLLYFTNLVGIMLACMITFWLMGYGSVRQARASVFWIFGLVGLLLIPLGASFTRLLVQARLQTSLKQVLLRGTLTFQRVDLIQTEYNWLSDPPEVRLVVWSSEPVTPNQVALIENYVQLRLRQHFRFIVQVSQTTIVTSRSTSSLDRMLPTAVPSPSASAVEASPTLPIELPLTEQFPTLNPQWLLDLTPPQPSNSPLESARGEPGS
jgi:uncharacterized hydrophobic protein (TIGR00271 family)